MLGYRKEIKYEDLTKLKYLGMCMKETLRLWPTVPGLSRMSKGDFKIKDYNIPDGTVLVVMIFLNIMKRFFKNIFRSFKIKYLYSKGEFLCRFKKRAIF